MNTEARRVVRRMEQHNWLTSYCAVEGINFAFHRLSLRSKALTGIQEAKKDFEQNYEDFRTDFLEFYPILLEFVKENS